MKQLLDALYTDPCESINFYPYLNIATVKVNDVSQAGEIPIVISPVSVGYTKEQLKQPQPQKIHGPKALLPL